MSTFKLPTTFREPFFRVKTNLAAKLLTSTPKLGNREIYLSLVKRKESLSWNWKKKGLRLIADKFTIFQYSTVINVKIKRKMMRGWVKSFQWPKNHEFSKTVWEAVRSHQRHSWWYTFTIISPALKSCTINNFLHEERYMSWFVWALYCSLGPPLYQMYQRFYKKCHRLHAAWFISYTETMIQHWLRFLGKISWTFHTKMWFFPRYIYIESLWSILFPRK